MSTSTIEIAAMYEFESESSPGKMYEALLYVDGSTSCNCKGWTMKKRTTNGLRTCTHTRKIDAGMAERHAKSFVVYQQVSTRKSLVSTAPLTTKTETQGNLAPRSGSRRFNLD